jgi:uncharacterized membrane protein
MKNIIWVILIAAAPVLELRGSIPFAIRLGLSPYQAFIASIIGNILPVPILLLLFSPISERLRRLPFLLRFFNWLEDRTKCRANIVEKYEFWGLVLFVAIPFPTTGAWTGSFAAAIFKMKFKSSLFAISIGVIIAASIVSLISWGGISLLKL